MSSQIRGFRSISSMRYPDPFLHKLWVWGKNLADLPFYIAAFMMVINKDQLTLHHQHPDLKINAFRIPGNAFLGVIPPKLNLTRLAAVQVHWGQLIGHDQFS